MIMACLPSDQLVENHFFPASFLDQPALDLYFATRCPLFFVIPQDTHFMGLSPSLRDRLASPQTGKFSYLVLFQVDSFTQGMTDTDLGPFLSALTIVRTS